MSELRATSPRVLTSKVLKSADGTEIFAEAIGDPSKPAVVFVHGFALSGNVFDLIFHDEKLLERLYLVRYDARGHARSGQPESEDAYTSSRYAQDFQVVTKTFNLHKPIWAGWSAGGAISTDILAELGPDSVAGIVYVGAVPCMGPLSDPMRTDVLNTIIGGLLSPDAGIFARAALDFVNACFKEPPSIPFDVRTSMLGTVVLQSTAARMRILMRTHDPTALFQAGAQGLPALAVFGTEDALINTDNMVETCRKHFRRFMVKPIEGAGHSPFIEKPDEFCQALLEFVEQL